MPRVRRRRRGAAKPGKQKGGNSLNYPVAEQVTPILILGGNRTREGRIQRQRSEGIEEKRMSGGRRRLLARQS
jgi:hypothetical protein